LRARKAGASRTCRPATEAQAWSAQKRRGGAKRHPPSGAAGFDELAEMLAIFQPVVTSHQGKAHDELDRYKLHMTPHGDVPSHAC